MSPLEADCVQPCLSVLMMTNSLLGDRWGQIRVLRGLPSVSFTNCEGQGIGRPAASSVLDANWGCAQIKADSEGAGARSYNYRVIMMAGGAELDMRGRCSAGQKARHPDFIS